MYIYMCPGNIPYERGGKIKNACQMSISKPTR